MLSSSTLPAQIASRIVKLRGARLILDSDLASLYGVRTKVLLQAVRRNPDRFPAEFVFALDIQDLAALRSQIVTSKPVGRGGRRYAVHAFTEYGAVMAATVLNSPRAIAVSILVVRAFVALRQSLTMHPDLVKRLDELEIRVAQKLGDQDLAIAEILEAIRQLTAPPAAPVRRGIGFVR
jgi:hypothetical protein